MRSQLAVNAAIEWLIKLEYNSKLHQASKEESAALKKKWHTRQYQQEQKESILNERMPMLLEMLDKAVDLFIDQTLESATRFRKGTNLDELRKSERDRIIHDPKAVKDALDYLIAFETGMSPSPSRRKKGPTI